MNFNIIQENLENEQEECEYESPNNSVWIVAVDVSGNVSVLDTPNMDPYFFDNGGSAEEMGLPPDCNLAPGVYRWTCSFYQHIDWETGHVDDYTFEPIKEELLWKLNK